MVSAVSSAGRGSRGGGTALAAVPSPGGWPGLVCCCLWGWGSSELGPEQLGEPAARAGGAHSQTWGQGSSCSPLGGEGEEISLGARSRQQHQPGAASMGRDEHPRSSSPVPPDTFAMCGYGHQTPPVLISGHGFASSLPLPHFPDPGMLSFSGFSLPKAKQFFNHPIPWGCYWKSGRSPNSLFLTESPAAPNALSLLPAQP